MYNALQPQKRITEEINFVRHRIWLIKFVVVDDGLVCLSFPIENTKKRYLP
jgi:hypothetical protein